MKDKKIFNLIENKKEVKNIFKQTAKISSPIQTQMVKFLHMNLLAEKDVLKGFSRFKPKDLQ